MEDGDDEEWNVSKHGGLSMVISPATLALRSGPINAATAAAGGNNNVVVVKNGSGGVVGGGGGSGSGGLVSAGRGSGGSRDGGVISGGVVGSNNGNLGNAITSASMISTVGRSSTICARTIPKIITTSNIVISNTSVNNNSNNNNKNNGNNTRNNNSNNYSSSNNNSGHSNKSNSIATTISIPNKEVAGVTTDGKPSEGRLSMLMSLKLPHYAATKNTAATTTITIAPEVKCYSLASGNNTANNDQVVKVSAATNVPTTIITTTKTAVAAATPEDDTNFASRALRIFNFELMAETDSPTSLSFWKAGRKMFRCDICAGEYKHFFSLKRHYLRSHISFKYVSQVDVVSCGVVAPKDAVAAVAGGGAVDADKPFSEEDESLKGDLNKDTESKNTMPNLYRCNVCGRFYDLKSQLQQHWKEHDNSSNNDNGTEKNFNCGSCKMTFRHKQNLIKHEITHTGWSIWLVFF